MGQVVTATAECNAWNWMKGHIQGDSIEVHMMNMQNCISFSAWSSLTPLQQFGEERTPTHWTGKDESVAGITS